MFSLVRAYHGFGELAPTVAGTVPPAGGDPWYASACSGLLGQQYPYTGVADLPQTAMSLAGAIDSAYYSALPHIRATQNNPLQLTSPRPEGRGFSALAGQGSCFTDGRLPALRAGWSHTISAGSNRKPGGQ